MWSIDYVQVPDEQFNTLKTNPDGKAVDSPKHSKPNNESFNQSVTQRHLMKQTRVFNEDIRMTSIKSGSESSLSEENLKSFPTRQRSEDYSNKEWINEQQDEKETCSDTEELVPPVAPARRRKSRVSMALRKSEGGNSAESTSLDIDDASLLRTSKSDTSITDSFVIITDTKKKTPNPMNQLRLGNNSFAYKYNF